MFKKTLLFALLLSFSIQAQHKISGSLEVSMASSHPYKWVVLYKINPFSHAYIQNSTIKDGKFSFVLPENTKTGVYRILYGLNNNKYVDVIFNNEDIAFTFNPENPSKDINYTSSKENKLYTDFTKHSLRLQKKLDSLQLAYIRDKKSAKSKALTQYKKTYANLNKSQYQFEQKSVGTLAHHFIVASKRFYTKQPLNTKKDFVKSIKAHYFNSINFKDTVLLNSIFIVDKINDYLFFLSNTPNRNEQDNKYQEAIDYIVSKVTVTNTKKDVVKFIINLFMNKDNSIVVNFAMNNYFLKYPQNSNDEIFRKKVSIRMKASVGNIAPEITWKENGEEKRLSNLNNAKNYIVVFWSSTCPHCLRQLPIFYKYLKDKKNIQVVAVGLENDDKNWKKVKTRFEGEGWINVLGLNKWKNKFARAYNVIGTPTFLILNSDKRIISKPEDVEDVEAFFNKKTS